MAAQAMDNERFIGGVSKKTRCASIPPGQEPAEGLCPLISLQTPWYRAGLQHSKERP
jgi:hypothetical protein